MSMGVCRPPRSFPRRPPHRGVWVPPDAIAAAPEAVLRAPGHPCTREILFQQAGPPSFRLPHLCKPPRTLLSDLLQEVTQEGGSPVPIPPGVHALSPELAAGEADSHRQTLRSQWGFIHVHPSSPDVREINLLV